MLFNSTAFVAGFLPVALAGFILIVFRSSLWGPIFWLVVASLFFYSWWDYRNLFILIPSVFGNYFMGRLIGEARQAGHGGRAKMLLILGIGLNLCAIGYFKYFNFFATTISTAMGLEYAARHILLPLGISFFTFQQIKFLVDRFTGTAPNQPDFPSYCLLVTFFPHVIAGPIVHYDELLPQFKAFRFSPALFADGVSVFLLGLAKKLVLADQFAAYADEGFNAAAAGYGLSFFSAWGAALGYTLQLYFDFSAYSDMAIGLARMFGLTFPLNFDSPYKAVNIIDFWRRWHITLSRFLRDYVYIPLGGNRQGPVRRHVNVMLTMLLGGLWHGAGWTFVAWGGLHGAYLVINHLWHGLRGLLGFPAGKPTLWGRLAAGPVTLLAVIIGWVFFRSQNFETASSVLRGMAGANGAMLPSQLIDLVPALKHVASGAGVVPFLAGGAVLGFVSMVVLIAAGFMIALLTPHLHQISARTRLLLLVPSFALTMQKLFLSSQAAPFLYFQF
jgi:D-alanyl-lipoteichoic acid acyltransferase DltB (MBOAT superfamily)